MLTVVMRTYIADGYLLAHVVMRHYEVRISV